MQISVQFLQAKAKNLGGKKEEKKRYTKKGGFFFFDGEVYFEIMAGQFRLGDVFVLFIAQEQGRNR